MATDKVNGIPLLCAWFDMYDSIRKRPPSRSRVLGKGRSHLPYRRQVLRLHSRQYKRGLHRPICPYMMRHFGRDHRWGFEGNALFSSGLADLVSLGTLSGNAETPRTSASPLPLPPRAARGTISCNCLAKYSPGHQGRRSPFGQ